MEELILKRLAVIKQLYLQGVAQSYNAEPMNGFSILSFHDSVEMFMKLCAEHKNIRIDRNVNFGDYFSKLPDLLCEATMTNLNSKRVNLKHYGALPSKLDVEISRVNVADFFQQNTPIFFGVSFEEISLSSLIKYESVREYVEQAQKYCNNDEYTDSITQSQIAFKELLASYIEENTKNFKSPFIQHHNFRFLSSFHLQIGLGHNFDEFIDQVSNSIPAIEETLNIIGLGIGYKQYCKFKLLEPHIQVWPTDTGRKYDYYIGQDQDQDRRICNKKNAEFCYNFVIDSSLRLQQFDIDIDDTIKDK